MAGCNYVPSCAVNSVEMWMRSSFLSSKDLIRRELDLACSIGMNTVRVFLPFCVYENEGIAFEETFEEFLSIADACGHKVLPILFDDCAFDAGSDPFYGEQLPPVPGVHNSRWVPSPGFSVSDNPEMTGKLKTYVQRIVGSHRDDPRILAWDLYNEPGNTGRKLKCLPLLVNVFSWARKERPSQPLTACIWNFAPEWEGLNRVIAELSDIINLHTYEADERSMQLCLAAANASGRPVIVTEWLHRPNGNTVEGLLPFFAENNIAVWQWGLIQGRTQTNLNWSTMGPQGVPDPNPALWQHDIFTSDLAPYRREETDLYRRLTGRG